MLSTAILYAYVLFVRMPDIVYLINVFIWRIKNTENAVFIFIVFKDVLIPID
jgi:hypothetical protein